MTRNDILYILADAMQQHEGWGDYDKVKGIWSATASTINKNQGNIKYVGQVGMQPSANGFCVAPTELDGKLLQIHDLGLKFDNHPTIRNLVSVYAPPSDNDTEAYIAAVVKFFNMRNVPATDTMTFQEMMALPIEIILIAIDDIWTPADWASVQTSIVMCAANMRKFAFSTRYVSRPIGVSDFYANASPIGNLYAVKEEVVRPLLAKVNEGQKMSLLFYLTIKEGEAGGVEYGGEAISTLSPMTAFGSLLFQGSVFQEPDSRTMFHELIHCLFTLTGIKDYLHDYVVAHGGYAANLLIDLNQVYGDIVSKYFSGSQAVKIGTQAVAIAAADKNPADVPVILQFLSAAWNALKNWEK